MSALPDSIFKRDVLFGARKVSPEQLIDYAKRYEEAGFLSDSVDFYSQAQAKDQLLRIATKVAAEGDAFLLLKVGRLLGSEVFSDELLKTCAEQARAQGKHRYAIMAYEKLGMGNEAAEVREIIKDDGDIVALETQDVFISSHQDEIEGGEAVETTKTKTRIGG